MSERADVPCNGCRACCQRDLILLSAARGDVIEDYDTDCTVDEDGHAHYTLKHKPNGECIYLGEHGCTIHERAPWLCRAFDCRKMFLQYAWPWQRVIWGHIPSEVFFAGRERLKQLT